MVSVFFRRLINLLKVSADTPIRSDKVCLGNFRLISLPDSTS